jgi:hypothetical protein
VFSEASRLIAAGVVFGSTIGLVGSRALKTLLFGVRPDDPSALAVVVLLMVLTGMLACRCEGPSCLTPWKRCGRNDAVRADHGPAQNLHFEATYRIAGRVIQFCRASCTATSIMTTDRSSSYERAVQNCRRHSKQGQSLGKDADPPKSPIAASECSSSYKGRRN